LRKPGASDNVSQKELKKLKDTAKDYFSLSDEQIERALKAGKFTEIEG
jgi:hypothetical protein